MDWLRTKHTGPIILYDGGIRHYLDAVRSDGFLFRAGIDFTGSKTDAEIKKMLADSINSYLNKMSLGKQVGVDAYKGESGWSEVVQDGQ